MLERGKLFKRSHRPKKKRHWCDWSNDPLSTPFFPNQLMRLQKKRINAIHERGKIWFQSLAYTKKQHLCHCCGLLNDAVFTLFF